MVFTRLPFNEIDLNIIPKWFLYNKEFFNPNTYNSRKIILKNRENLKKVGDCITCVVFI